MPLSTPTKNPIARCLDALGDTTLFAANKHGTNWSRQFVFCSPTEGVEPAPKNWRYRSALALFLSVTTILVILKLLQTVGQAGLASAQAAGDNADNPNNSTWVMFTALMGGIGSTIITIFTRLQCMVETFAQLILPNCSLSEEKREINRRIKSEKTLLLTTPLKKLSYWILRSLFLSFSVIAVAFKGVNGGLFGLVLGLKCSGFSLEQIDRLKKGDPKDMPEGSFFIYSCILMIAVASFVSSFIFDIVRKAQSKSHEAAMSFICKNTKQGVENKKVWSSAFILGFIYSVCSVVVAYVSTNMALTVFLRTSDKSAIKKTSLVAALNSLPAMMLSARADGETMLGDIFLGKLPLHIRSGLNSPFSLTCFGHPTSTVDNLKITITFSMLLLLFCGLFDTYNNTGGTQGSLRDVFINEFGWEYNIWHHATAWTLATLSAVTYIANTLWIALKVAGSLWGVIPGKLITNDEGLSALVQDDARASYDDLDAPLMDDAPGPDYAHVTAINRWGGVDSDEESATLLMVEPQPERSDTCCLCL